MFSGIIEGTGLVVASTKRSDGIVALDVEVPFDADDVVIGDSICIEGVCLTVVRMQGRTLTFEVMPETIRCTSLSSIVVGSRVNVERSLVVGARVHGHFVFGHVDGVAKLVRRHEKEGNVQFTFSIPEGLRKYFARKGSISVKGVSLTLGEITQDTFSVYLIPHTLKITTLGALNVGDSANVEIDMLARYACGEG